MSQYFPKPYELDTSSFTLKSNVASLKPVVDKLDIDKSVPVPGGLNKLSDVVKNNIFKKTVYINQLLK